MIFGFLHLQVNCRLHLFDLVLVIVEFNFEFLFEKVMRDALLLLVFCCILEFFLKVKDCICQLFYFICPAIQFRLKLWDSIEFLVEGFVF